MAASEIKRNVQMKLRACKYISSRHTKIKHSLQKPLKTHTYFSSSTLLFRVAGGECFVKLSGGETAQRGQGQGPRAHAPPDARVTGKRAIKFITFLFNFAFQSVQLKNCLSKL